jgi:hypothetical protein
MMMLGESMWVAQDDEAALYERPRQVGVEAQVNWHWERDKAPDTGTPLRARMLSTEVKVAGQLDVPLQRCLVYCTTFGPVCLLLNNTVSE